MIMKPKTKMGGDKWLWERLADRTVVEVGFM